MYKQRRLYLLFFLIFTIGFTYLLVSINIYLSSKNEPEVIHRTSTTSVHFRKF